LCPTKTKEKKTNADTTEKIKPMRNNEIADAEILTVNVDVEFLMLTSN